MRGEQAIGETGRMQRRPEAVTRSRKVMSYGGGIKSRINPDEQHLEPGRDDIRYFFIPRRA